MNGANDSIKRINRRFILKVGFTIIWKIKNAMQNIRIFWIIIVFGLKVQKTANGHANIVEMPCAPKENSLAPEKPSQEVFPVENPYSLKE